MIEKKRIKTDSIGDAHGDYSTKMPISGPLSLFTGGSFEEWVNSLKCILLNLRFCLDLIFNSEIENKNIYL